MKNLNPEYLDRVSQEEYSSIYLFDFHLRYRKTDEFQDYDDPTLDYRKFGLSELAILNSIRVRWSPLDSNDIFTIHDWDYDQDLNEIMIRDVWEYTTTVGGQQWKFERGCEIGSTIYVNYSYYKIFRFAQFPENVQYAGATYTAWPIGFDHIEYDLFGGSSRCRINMSAVDLSFLHEIQDIEIIGSLVTIHQEVWPFVGGTHPIWMLRIAGYEFTEETISIQCDPLISFPLGRRPMRRFHYKCPWSFNDQNCRYSTDTRYKPPAATYCDKTYLMCRSLGNEYNFGGFDI